jgi:hypothetical protein
VGDSKQPSAKPKVRPRPPDRPKRRQERLLNGILGFSGRQHLPAVPEQRRLIPQHDRFERRDAPVAREFD